jgi:anti-sigma factor RsiW
MVELLNDYLDGALPASEAAHVEAHVSDCDGCETALAQCRETIRRSGSLTEDQIPADQRDLLLGAFRGTHSGG